eukprot:PhM_4_TR18841/c0_g1_i1/m.70312/K01202/GALC; galactosylceramidase
MGLLFPRCCWPLFLGLVISVTTTNSNVHAMVAQHDNSNIFLELDNLVPTHGVGSLSGAGTKLLHDYPSPQREDMLDFLFKPAFGAALRTLKVEIGGTGYSFSGALPSFWRMNSSSSSGRSSAAAETTRAVDDHQMWLVREARHRNPNLTVLATAYTWPHWIDQTVPFPTMFDMSQYVAAWVSAAQTAVGGHIDAVGLWERDTCNVELAQVLRKSLDNSNLTAVQVFACESTDWIIEDLVRQFPSLDGIVSAMTSRYPGRYGLPRLSSAPIHEYWATEDGSHASLGCIGRTINNNVISGLSSTILFKLATGSYETAMEDFDMRGLIDAQQPWSGSYNVQAHIWAVAHTNWFLTPGALFAPSASGTLHESGGTYVTYYDNRSANLVVVLERLTASKECDLSYYNNAARGDRDLTVTFAIDGGVHVGSAMYAWVSSEDGTSTMKAQPTPVSISSSDNTFSINITRGTIVTLTSSKSLASTLPTSAPTPPHTVPAPAGVPLPMHMDFTWTKKSNSDTSLPPLLLDQSGTFRVIEKSLRQSAVGKALSLTPMFDQSPLTLLGGAGAFPASYTVRVQFRFRADAAKTSSLFAIGVELSRGPDFNGILIAVGADKTTMASSKLPYLKLGNIRRGRLSRVNVADGASHNLTVFYSPQRAVFSMLDSEALFSMIPCCHYRGGVGLVVGDYSDDVEIEHVWIN